ARRRGPSAGRCAGRHGRARREHGAGPEGRGAGRRDGHRTGRQPDPEEGQPADLGPSSDRRNRGAEALMADRLYLLNPDWFDDQGGRWSGPPGARIEGVLGLYPRLREHLTVTYLDPPRPRPAVIAEVGEANQSCPLLVLDGEFDWPDAQVSEETGARFLQDDDILPYWAARYGIGRPHPGFLLLPMLLGGCSRGLCPTHR